jgi:hypothetical protein
MRTLFRDMGIIYAMIALGHFWGLHRRWMETHAEERRAMFEKAHCHSPLRQNVALYSAIAVVAASWPWHLVHHWRKLRAAMEDQTVSEAS